MVNMQGKRMKSTIHNNEHSEAASNKQKSPKPHLNIVLLQHPSKRLKFIFISMFAVMGLYLTLHSFAANNIITMRPTRDIDKSTIVGVGDNVNAFNDIDDGTSFTAADDSTTYVRGMANINTSYHLVGYSGAPAGVVSQVTVNYRAQQATAVGTAQVQLYDGTTLIGVGKLQTLGANYINYSDTFGGLSVADANNLSTKLIFQRTSGTGALRYTLIWLDVTLGNTAAQAPTVNFTSPTAGSTVSGSNQAVSADASDAVSVSGVQFKLDNVNLGAELTAAPYTVNWDTTKATNGNHTLSAVARNSAGLTATASESVTVSNTVTTTGDPVIGVAGDISCDPADTSYSNGNGDAKNCHMLATSNLLLNSKPALSAVLTLGDNQYENGTLTKYRQSYALNWGRLKSVTRPVTGNHEYGTSGAGGYFDYFNGVGVTNGSAGERGKGYYSYDIGSWHIIAINSGNAPSKTGAQDCGILSCVAGSPEETWLKADLAAHSNSCTLAYWHHPRWSTGDNGNNDYMQAIWSDLAASKADVVLNGHSHDYERFTPMNAGGVADPNGIREFVVGTGGVNEIGFPMPAAPTTQARFKAYGILKLTLHANSYDWQFVHDPTSPFTPLTAESGSGACH